MFSREGGLFSKGGFCFSGGEAYYCRKFCVPKLVGWTIKTAWNTKLTALEAKPKQSVRVYSGSWERAY